MLLSKDSIVYTPYHVSNRNCSYGYRILTGHDPTLNEPWFDTVGCYIDSTLIGDTVNDGLCVGKIISKDGMNWQHTTTTEYAYDSSERFNRGGYMHYFDNGGLKVLTNYFVSPDNYFRGSNHGFSKVTVTVKGYAGQQLSKKVNYFSNNIFTSGGHDSTSYRKPTGPQFLTMPPDFRKYRVGLPLRMESYDQSNNLLAEVENSFDYISHSPEITNGRTFSNTIIGTWQYHVIDHEVLRLKSTRTVAHIGNHISSDTVIYSNDSHDNVTVTTIRDSKGDVLKTYTYYNYNLVDDMGISAYALSVMHNVMQIPLVTKTWKMLSATDSILTDCSVNVPQFPGSSNNGYAFTRYYSAKIKEPLNKTNANSSTYINLANALDPDLNNAGLTLLNQSRTTYYELASNLSLETKHNNQDVYSSLICDTKTRRIIAQATNAKFFDIAYTSFESTYFAQGVWDANKGNWDFDSDNITTEVGGITGPHSYKIEGPSTYIDSRPLQHKKYLLTFWLHSSAADSTIPGLTGGLNCVLRNTVGNWKLYSAIVEPDSGQIIGFSGYTPTLGSTPIFYIDEIRLHPIDAVMTSCTYTPLANAQSISDVNNVISYYEYDLFGRPAIVRDMRGNIIKKFETVCGDSNKSNDGLPMSGGGNHYWNPGP